MSTPSKPSAAAPSSNNNKQLSLTEISEELKELTKKSLYATTNAQLRPLFGELIKMVGIINQQQQATIDDLQQQLSNHYAEMQDKFDMLFNQHQQQYNEMQQQQQHFPFPQQQGSPPPIKLPFGVSDKDRSVIIDGVPESQESTPSMRDQDDFVQLNQLFDQLNIEFSIDKHYRIGRSKNNEPRIIKCVFACVGHQRAALQAAHAGNRPLHIKIRPSFDAQHRRWYAHRKREIFRLKQMYPHLFFVVYKGRICTATPGIADPVPFNFNREELWPQQQQIQIQQEQQQQEYFFDNPFVEQ